MLHMLSDLTIDVSDISAISALQFDPVPRYMITMKSGKEWLRCDTDAESERAALLTSWELSEETA